MATVNGFVEGKEMFLLIFVNFGLLAIAVLLAITGIFLASEATFGVAIIGIGILCAIVARIAQAGYHHSIIEARLSKPPEKPSSTE